MLHRTVMSRGLPRTGVLRGSPAYVTLHTGVPSLAKASPLGGCPGADACGPEPSVGEEG